MPPPAARRARPALCKLTTLCAWTTLLFALPAAAQVSVAGFGTAGYARSDQPYKVQRFIDDHGTFMRDSLLGVQVDARLTPQWSATAQVRLAPSIQGESSWDVEFPWAFVSWRADNDLLLRAGKLRLPLLMHTENLDVGATYDFLRLPAEVYANGPLTGITGASFVRTWTSGESEWALDGYVGRMRHWWRLYRRDPTPDGQPPGPMFESTHVKLAGLVLSLQQHDHRFRLGAHRLIVTRDGGPFAQDMPFVPLAPGIGYYQVSNDLPGPGVPMVDRLYGYTFTAGAEIALPRDVRVAGEYIRRIASNATLGADNWGAYVAVLQRIGAWTPYVYAARTRSSDAALALYSAINNTVLPASIPGAALINAAQRMGADALDANDQTSWAVGASWALSPTARLKAEWLHTRTGQVSSFVNAPPGENSGQRRINVLSLSYSFAF